MNIELKEKKTLADGMKHLLRNLFYYIKYSMNVDNKYDNYHMLFTFSQNLRAGAY